MKRPVGMVPSERELAMLIFRWLGVAGIELQVGGAVLLGGAPPARGKSNRCPYYGPTVIISLIRAKVAGPTPGTFWMSSMRRNGP